MDGNPAPTFWNCESEEKQNKENTETRIKKIEDIAKMLISASEDEAMCDEHQKELQEIRYEKLENECTNCYTEEFDFEKSAEHNFYYVLPNSCEQCEVQKKLIKDFSNP